MPAIVLMKSGNDVYIRSDRNGIVPFYLTVEEGVAAQEAINDACHYRGYESSMSSVIANINLQIGIINVPESVEHLYSLVGKEPRVTRLSSIAVRTSGIKLSPEHVWLFDEAVKPRLITKNANKGR